MSAESPGEHAPGLQGALGRLGTALLGLAHTRLELAAVEFGEERARLVGRLALVLIAILAFAGALFAASALVVVWFWDTHRVAALIGVGLFYMLVGGAALWRMRELGRSAQPPFGATLATLERDREWLAGHMKGEP
jgi:uncharacterized membrane protein YqjE